jgi:hypothetical protein
MTDDDMRFLANVLKEGPKDRVIQGLIKQWDDLWKDWAEVGKAQERLERAGVGGTEADSLFKARLEPKIARFEKTFADLMGHLRTVANK